MDLERPTVIRARIARAKQQDAAPEVIEALRADYYASRARDYVRDWLTSDPAPTAAHRAQVASLLLAGSADAAA
jgi:hypothetical protein